jgi:hypothetical protein
MDNEVPFEHIKTLLEKTLLHADKWGYKGKPGSGKYVFLLRDGCKLSLEFDLDNDSDFGEVRVWVDNICMSMTDLESDAEWYEDFTARLRASKRDWFNNRYIHAKTKST